MNVLETILNFLTNLARIIFPRKRKPAAGDCPCPHPMPAPPEPALPSDAGDGSDPDLYRGDTLALAQGDWGSKPTPTDWPGISGYSLMLIGSAACVYKWFIA
ncbi:hypothetical protein [Parabacteroides goldsteinii]|uniref:hypothetical protein n=1 Tax=Parabacteroides goldsteinii TaxID=328812 RepID=UPI00321AE755